MELQAHAVGIRAVSLVIVFAFSYFAPPLAFVAVAIALGLGHFGIAYLYQVEGGHLSRGRLALLLVAAVFFGVLVYVGWVRALGFINGVGFLVHFSLDEVRLWGGKHSFFTTLEALPPVALVTGIFAEGYFTQDWFAPVISIAVLALLAYLFLAFWKRRAPNAVSLAFYFWGALSFIAYVFVRFAPERAFEAFWIVALLHFAVWYGFYWYKLERAPSARTTYIVRALAINGVLLFLAIVFLNRPAIALLGVLFSITLFFVLSLLHGLASMRPQELKASMRLSP